MRLTLHPRRYPVLRGIAARDADARAQHARMRAVAGIVSGVGGSGLVNELLRTGLFNQVHRHHADPSRTGTARLANRIGQDLRVVLHQPGAP